MIPALGASSGLPPVLSSQRDSLSALVRRLNSSIFNLSRFNAVAAQWLQKKSMGEIPSANLPGVAAAIKRTVPLRRGSLEAGRPTAERSVSFPPKVIPGPG